MQSNGNNGGISQQEAQQVVALWKQNFPNVTVITSPSNGQPFLTLAHGFYGVNSMQVNGLAMKSPLFTMGLYSSEVAQDANGDSHYAHAYEMMFPNVPSLDGTLSNVGTYVQTLWDSGFEVHADHYHWKDAHLMPAIHHMGVGMTPSDFTRGTINALNVMFARTAELSGQHAPTPLTSSSSMRMGSMKPDIISQFPPGTTTLNRAPAGASVRKTNKKPF